MTPDNDTASPVGMQGSQADPQKSRLRGAPAKGTSHEQWVKYDADGKLLGKVTVDCPKAPFSQDSISFMAQQAGVSKNDFYEALGT